jgi:hypothetical protein
MAAASVKVRTVSFNTLSSSDRFIVDLQKIRNYFCNKAHFGPSFPLLVLLRGDIAVVPKTAFCQSGRGREKGR